MSDEEVRQLERQAKEGDPGAKPALAAMLRRVFGSPWLVEEGMSLVRDEEAFRAALVSGKQATMTIKVRDVVLVESLRQRTIQGSWVGVVLKVFGPKSQKSADVLASAMPLEIVNGAIAGGTQDLSAVKDLDIYRSDRVVVLRRNGKPVSGGAK